MINKLHEIPTFSLFNNYEIIRKIKYKINEIIDAINNQPEPVEPYEVVYSYDERKIGSYFGFDLYEKSFNITADDYNSGENAYTIDLDESADKIINCDGFIYSINENDIPYKLKLPINTEPKLILGVDRKTETICTKIYDRSIVEDVVYNASVFIYVDATDYINSTGIIKVQYTKRIV